MYSTRRDRHKSACKWCRPPRGDRCSWAASRAISPAVNKLAVKNHSPSTCIVGAEQLQVRHQCQASRAADRCASRRPTVFAAARTSATPRPAVRVSRCLEPIFSASFADWSTFLTWSCLGRVQRHFRIVPPRRATLRQPTVRSILEPWSSSSPGPENHPHTPPSLIVLGVLGTLGYPAFVIMFAI